MTSTELATGIPLGTPLALPLAVAASVSAGAVGGVYLAFSAMVMPALDRLGPARAADAMRAVNAAAERPVFLSLFFGSALLAGAVVTVELTGAPAPAGPEDGARWAGLLGGGLSVAGFLLTLGRNVPLNRRLAVDRTEGAWSRYRAPWTRANSLRAAASIAGAALLALHAMR